MSDYQSWNDKEYLTIPNLPHDADNTSPNPPNLPMKAPELVLSSHYNMDIQLLPHLIWLPAHDPEDQLDDGEEDSAKQEALEEEEDGL